MKFSILWRLNRIFLHEVLPTRGGHMLQVYLCIIILLGLFWVSDEMHQQMLKALIERVSVVAKGLL